MSERSGSNDGEAGRPGSPTGEGEDAGESRPFIDDVFGALADWRRREVCQFFRETDATTATVDELALLLRGCEPACEPVPSDRDHDDVVADLEERHLPALDVAGVLDYDERSNTVHYWGQPTLEKWLEHVVETDRHD